MALCKPCSSPNIASSIWHRSIDPPWDHNDVLVAVKACGICGSDVHGYDGSSGRRIPPIVMGHEASGVVAEVGADVERFNVGDRVTFDSTIFCGECDACRSGYVNLCGDRRVLGVSCGDYRQHGAFADYVLVPQQIVYRLPENVPFEHAALVEPVAVALHGVNRLRIAPGDRAVVVGGGMIGQLVLQALRLAGCESVIVVDLDDSRLALAAELGAAETINPRHDRPDRPNSRHHRRPRGRRFDGSRRQRRRDCHGDRLRPPRRPGGARRQCDARGTAAAADRRHARAHAARLLRIGRRVFPSGRAAWLRRDSRRVRS